ncbi:hypothetical protein I4U23_007986 [Adineta vaga]|nr:hypothetical protein I4U23_007986 [Adineta vaga]
MGSLSSYVIKLMICLVFLCTFIRTQPLFAADADDDDQQAQMENFFFNNYADLEGQYPYPGSLINYHQERLSHPKQAYHPDDVHLAKRIIMLPRVGRRSVQPTSHE